MQATIGVCSVGCTVLNVRANGSLPSRAMPKARRMVDVWMARQQT